MILRFSTFVENIEEYILDTDFGAVHAPIGSKSGAEGEQNIGLYMSSHRQDTNINELRNYFNSVISWIDSVFINIEDEMQGLPWGEFYTKYHDTPYDRNDVASIQKRLYADSAVKSRKGIFEYILGGCTQPRLLEIRYFEDSVKKAKYAQQTEEAQAKGISNCPHCVLENSSNKTKIWKLTEMDADHVTAWSKGGATDISNCQMLCQTHNRAKGNK